MGRCAKVVLFTGRYSSYGETDLGPTGEPWRHATTMPSFFRDASMLSGQFHYGSRFHFGVVVRYDYQSQYQCDGCCL